MPISRGRVLNIGVAYNELNVHNYIAYIMNATEYRMVYYVGFSLPSCKVGHINKFD